MTRMLVLPQEVPKESLAKTQQQPVTNAISTEEFKDINVTIDVDWNVKKEKQTKYIVTIQNKSNRNFSGTVKIVPTTSRTMGSFDVNIDQLIPNEMKTVFSFVEIKSDTKFEYKVSGSFSDANSKTDLDYKTIKTIPGNGYMTFWIYTPNVKKENLIAISKEMRSKYSSLKLGFQLRFFDKEHPREMSENVAAYALTPHLKLSRLTMFDNNDEIVNIE